MAFSSRVVALGLVDRVLRSRLEVIKVLRDGDNNVSNNSWNTMMIKIVDSSICRDSNSNSNNSKTCFSRADDQMPHKKTIQTYK